MIGFLVITTILALWVASAAAVSSDARSDRRWDDDYLGY